MLACLQPHKKPPAQPAAKKAQQPPPDTQSVSAGGRQGQYHRQPQGSSGPKADHDAHQHFSTSRTKRKVAAQHRPQAKHSDGQTGHTSKQRPQSEGE